MLKCCICGKELQRPTSWACARCRRSYSLSFSPGSWPEWAQAERRREETRRRMRSQGYGGGGQLTYSPYSRRRENVVYRKANHVSKRGRADAERVSADNLLYSTRGDESPLDTECYYQRAMETLPNDLQHRLSARQEIKAIISDAIASLPLISQRAIKGSLDGWSVAEIAASEGIKESTMEWLLDQAKQRLAEILSEKVGADNGVRYR